MRFFLISILITFSLLIAPFYTLAQTTVVDGSLRATFSSVPLFTSPHAFAPGMKLTASTTLENLGTDNEDILFSVENEFSTGLADVLIFTIKNNGSTLYEDTLQNFFVDAPHSIGTIDTNTAIVYDLAVSFASSSGNNYQGSSAGFDLMVGFSDGSTVVAPGGGGSGNSGGGTPGASNTLPPGEVAGAFDENESYPEVMGITDVVSNWFNLNAKTSQKEKTETEDDSITTELEEEVAGVSDSGIFATFGNISGEEDDCTFWWLFILGVILLIGSLINHYFRPANDSMGTGTFTTILFSSTFILLTWIAWFTGILSSMWWVLALAWFVYFGYEHLYLLETGTLWNKPLYYIYYIGAGLIFAGTAWLFNIPCEWWPFVGLAAFAAILSVREFFSSKF